VAAEGAWDNRISMTDVGVGQVGEKYPEVIMWQGYLCGHTCIYAHAHIHMHLLPTFLHISTYLHAHACTHTCTDTFPVISLTHWILEARTLAAARVRVWTWDTENSRSEGGWSGTVRSEQLL
jgi:hypothetical protein